MWDFIKKIFRDICSAALDIFLFITGLILIVAFVGGLFVGKFLPAALMGLAGLGFCTFGSRKLWLTKWQMQREKAKALAPIKAVELSETNSGNTVSDFTQESYEKAVADYNSLNDIIRRLSDRELIEQLKKMQEIALKMLNYMQQHPEKISLANQFINYYQDRALSLSQQFLEFEEMNLNTKEIAQVKAKTKITLDAFDEAYEAQFSRMVSDKIMEMESELQVASQIMSDAGIRNQPKRTSPTMNTSQDASQTDTDTFSSSGGNMQADLQNSAENIIRDFRIDRPFDTCREKQKCHSRPRGRFQK